MRAYDVVVAGASVAGCSTAILLARQGLSVALLERSPEAGAHKPLCTHYIQSSALPVIERLGLAPLLEAAGAVPNAIDVHTRWGWVREPAADPAHPAHGYNIRRETLDPLLRGLAAATPGLDLRLGHTVTDLVREGGQVRGVRAQDAAGAAVSLQARLVVGADGRASRVAALGGIAGRTSPNGRFFYFAQYRGLPEEGGRSRMWFLEPDIAYTFPNDDGITVVAVAPAKAGLKAFKADREASFARFVRALPDGPNLDRAVRVGPVMGFVDWPNLSRIPAGAGLALVGDAALSVDPIWGTGCAFAFRSADWLAAAAGPALAAGASDAALAASLSAYARHHRAGLAGHAFHIRDFATGRSWRWPERLLFSAAAHDEECARDLFAFAARNIGLGQFLSPAALLRAARVNLAQRRRAPRAADAPALG
ncbi:NAD(P)/FAD-dependent oxidoreductase [Methylobacterium durans]|uniref:Monooxygenase n=1 Tax=Methylobacterium durans TaxID=2202825 RepID=A0A2U8WCB0_9HYPH|nr:NAD(P)/FAD-dependent oxidoreductase [Methylobacterium durans]AWN43689.1 monooxygenase [Methylobacterium durans]